MGSSIQSSFEIVGPTQSEWNAGKEIKMADEANQN